MPPGHEVRKQRLKEPRLGSDSLCMHPAQALLTTTEGAGSTASFLHPDPYPTTPCRATEQRETEARSCQA